jgi:hypothetical protein
MAMKTVAAKIILGWMIGGRKFVLTLALTFYPLPPGEEIAIGRFWFCGRPFGKSSRANFQGDGERFSFSLGRRPG